MTDVAKEAATGSSPLARGLLEGRQDLVHARRIIPARAGFTHWPTRWAGIPRDHPRSRGVYSLAAGACPPPAGSSPLARGLPRPRPAHSWPRRIIPARAGFTADSASSDTGHSGSSPLARGLHAPARGYGAGAGIIPARAGFTSTYRAGRQPYPDHPRSRGVYVRDRARRFGLTGSSPLARGLLNYEAGNALTQRIIPARAGFTHVHPEQSDTPLDHPRSRGVYTVWRFSLMRSRGSSPLARGLRETMLGMYMRLRIIPARAGFTSRGAWRKLT